MIIIGYQGIGKSTLAGKNGCIDLESGNFWFYDEETKQKMRHSNWYIPYCQIANHLSEQGYTVFVSSHEVVRNELKKSDQRVIVVCPDLHLKDEWIKKLEDRYEYTGLEKDFKAFKNAFDRYEENIKELLYSGFDTYAIDSMDYVLSKIIEEIS